MRVFYIPICFPNEEEFFKILDIMENQGVKTIEIGIPVTDAFLDGKIIQETNKKLLDNGLTAEKVEETLSKIKEKYDFQVILMTYKEGIELFSLNTLPKTLFDGILCVAEELDSEEFPNKVVFISSESDLSKMNDPKNEPPFIYLASSGTTGSLVDFQTAPYRKLLPEIKKRTSIPVYVGFGVKSIDDIQIILENGSDGVIIGSELLKKYNENGLSGVQQYVESLY